MKKDEKERHESQSEAKSSEHKLVLTKFLSADVYKEEQSWLVPSSRTGNGDLAGVFCPHHRFVALKAPSSCVSLLLECRRLQEELWV